MKVEARSVTVALRSASATIGVVADTHSNPNALGLEHLAALKPDVLLHAGDIGDVSVLERLEAIAPVHAVRGNIDARTPGLPDELTVTLMRGESVELRLFLLHIAVNGPRLRADVKKKAKAAKAQLVVCGHSHVPFIGREQELTVFNPGSIGPRRFTLPILYGAIVLSPERVQLKHFDAHTGEPWLPPH